MYRRASHRLALIGMLAEGCLRFISRGITRPEGKRYSSMAKHSGWPRSSCLVVKGWTSWLHWHSQKLR